MYSLRRKEVFPKAVNKVFHDFIRYAKKIDPYFQTPDTFRAQQQRTNNLVKEHMKEPYLVVLLA